jgi:hypothetical protein
MKSRRNIYIVVISIIIYFLLSFIYSKYIQKSEFSYIYYLAKDVLRGDKILQTDLLKTKISADISNNYLDSYPEDGYYKDAYPKGTIVLNSTILNNDEYIKTKLDNEVISIKLNFAADAASYQIEKNNIVNIFYSAKLSEFENIYNDMDNAGIVSNDSKNGYVTIKLLENVKIINCYDKYGNVTEKGNVIDTILIEVSNGECTRINNLKNYGEFSVSIVK